MTGRSMQNHEGEEHRPTPELRLDPRGSPDAVARVFGTIWEAISVILFSLRWVLLQPLRGIGWTGVILLIAFWTLGAVVMALWTLIGIAICVFANHVPDGVLRGTLISGFDSILFFSLVVLTFYYGNQVHAAVSRGIGIRNPIKFTDGLQAGASRMAWIADGLRDTGDRSERRRRREQEEDERRRREMEDIQRANRRQKQW